MTKFIKYCMEYVYGWSTSAPVASFMSNRKLQNLNSAARYIYHTFVVNMYHVLLNIIEKILCYLLLKTCQYRLFHAHTHFHSVSLCLVVVIQLVLQV